MHLLHSPPIQVLANSPSTNLITFLKSASAIAQSSHSYTTTPATPSTRPRTTTNTTKRTYFSTSLPFVPIRHASTTTDVPSSAPQTNLNWNEFLRLRRIRRYYNLGGSVITGFCGVLLSASLIANQDVAGYGQQLTGLDPVVIMGAWTLGFGGAGWLIGPVMGTAVFGMIYRRFGSQMRMKERDFFDRIKKYRVDPTSSSMQNPVPDYYGEKITSVAGYRRWLKDQRAFNKKRQSFV